MPMVPAWDFRGSVVQRAVVGEYDVRGSAFHRISERGNSLIVMQRKQPERSSAFQRFTIVVGPIVLMLLVVSLSLVKTERGEGRREMVELDWRLAWLSDAEVRQRTDAIFTRVAADMKPADTETVTGLSVEPVRDAADAANIVEIDALKWYGCGCCEYGPLKSTFSDDDFAVVSQFSKIEKLTLSLTQVTDVGLYPLERMHELTWLDLSDGEFSDHALRSVGRLHRLEHLDLSGNRLTGEGVQFLSKLRGLKFLDLSRTDLLDEELRHVAGLASLEVLVLDDTPIDGSGLRHLAGLDRLQSLSLANSQISSDGLSHLPALPALEICVADKTSVARGLSVFERMPSLKSLYLNETNVDDESLAELAAVIWLEELGLDGTPVSDDGLRHLANMTALRSLNVNNSKARGVGIQSLKNCRELSFFAVYADPQSAIDLEPPVMEAISKLKNLSSLRVRLQPAAEGRPSFRLSDMPHLGALTVICPGPVDQIELLNVPTLNTLQIVGEPLESVIGWPVEYADVSHVRRIAIRNAGKRFYGFDIPVPDELECDGPELIYQTRLNGRITRQIAKTLETVALRSDTFLRIAQGSDPEAVADLLVCPTDREEVGGFGLSIELEEFNEEWSRAVTRAMADMPGYDLPLRIRAKRLTGDSPISLGGISRLRHLQLEGFSNVDYLRFTAEDMPPDLEELTIRDAEIGTLEFESCHVSIMAEDMIRFDRLVVDGDARPYHYLSLFHEWNRGSPRDSHLLQAPHVVELRNLPHVEECSLQYGAGVRELRIADDCPKLKRVSYTPPSIVRFPAHLYRSE